MYVSGLPSLVLKKNECIWHSNHLALGRFFGLPKVYQKEVFRYNTNTGTNVCFFWSMIDYLFSCFYLYPQHSCSSSLPTFFIQKAILDESSFFSSSFSLFFLVSIPPSLFSVHFSKFTNIMVKRCCQRNDIILAASMYVEWIGTELLCQKEKT